MAMLVAALATFGFAPAASAHTGIWANFDYCPSTNPSAVKCIHSLTTGGRVVLGKKNVPIVNPVTLQGGLTKPERVGINFVAHMIAATNGETLSKTPQPVPGGLAGLVNCKEIENFIARIGCEAVFENGLTGVNATLELAQPANEVLVNENAILEREEVALKLPVKVHLENPFLGSSCYVGSSSTPLIWNLTTGTTAPPAGHTPLTGEEGLVEFLESNEIIRLTGTELVENNWPAPHASGCGGWPLEYIIDPIIDASVGLPSAAGVNEAVLVNTIVQANAAQVNEH
ncbi:MAG TPA: hypothetical protein VGH14_10310 [Solirubrobacterales bacterium]